MTIFNHYRYLPKQEIEKQVEHLLQKLMSKVNLTFPLDPTFVAELLDLDTDICHIPPEGNQPVAAMLIPLEQKIIINENCADMPQGFEESSIAHEIGHWILHINRKTLTEYRQRQQLGLKVPDIPPLHRIYQVQNLPRIEWQAQYFAGCLLMPKFKLVEAKKGRNLTNWKHLYAMADELGVSISNLTRRLQDLDWIYIPNKSKRIYLSK